MEKGTIKERIMGLASSQARLLTLTSRKADCEYNISIDSMEKMALARETSHLAMEYSKKLKMNQISYYAGGQYNKMTYQYLMGSSNYVNVLNNNGHIKSNNKMILTDFHGRTVLSDDYARYIKSITGVTPDASGKGGTFSSSYVPYIIAAIIQNDDLTPELIKAIHDGNGTLNESYMAQLKQTLTQNNTGSAEEVDVTEYLQSILKPMIDFYYPIFEAAATNGWTTEYNTEMTNNSDYISDALISGIFQLATVNDDGYYSEGDSLMYFITTGDIEQRNDTQAREDVTAWYEAEKYRLKEKEDILDIEIKDLSAELEAIKTEMEAIQSIINDEIQNVFDWGSS